MNEFPEVNARHANLVFDSMDLPFYVRVFFATLRIFVDAQFCLPYRSNVGYEGGGRLGQFLCDSATESNSPPTTNLAEAPCLPMPILRFVQWAWRWENRVCCLLALLVKRGPWFHFYFRLWAATPCSNIRLNAPCGCAGGRGFWRTRMPRILTITVK